jgi:hypothetical protein
LIASRYVRDTAAGRAVRQIQADKEARALATLEVFSNQQQTEALDGSVYGTRSTPTATGGPPPPRR